MALPADYVKTLHKVALDQAVVDLVKDHINSSEDRAKRDLYTAKLDALAAIGLSISKDAMYKQVDRKKKQLEQEGTRLPAPEIMVPPSVTRVSSLASPSSFSRNLNESNISEHDGSDGTAALKPKSGRPKESTY